MKEFTDQLWRMKPDSLVGWMSSRRPGDGDYEYGKAVLEAKTLVAMERTARFTLWLVVVTFLLAVVTVVAVLAK
jgi:hypothetical protein